MACETATIIAATTSNIIGRPSGVREGLKSPKNIFHLNKGCDNLHLHTIEEQCEILDADPGRKQAAAKLPQQSDSWRFDSLAPTLTTFR